MMVVERIRDAWMNRQVLSGLVLIVTGLVLFTIEWQAWNIRWWSSWWALLLFVLGVLRLLDPGEADAKPGSRRPAAWLIGIGIWGFVSESRLFGLTYLTSWPLLVVTGGVSMLWRAVEEPPPEVKRPRGGDHD